MIYLLSPQEMRIADNFAIDKNKIPGILLMENAARSAADTYRSLFSSSKATTTLIFCGVGNNGGDGFALARHLKEDTNVFIFVLGDVSKMSEETKTNFLICEALDIPINFIKSEDDILKINLNVDYIIDALIGVGAGDNLRGLIITLLSIINDSYAIKVAIDLPSGLNSETGVAHQSAFKADYTITMFAPKKGMYLNKGPILCGEIFVANLGTPKTTFKELATTYILEKKDVAKKLPQRKKNSSKFNYGSVLIIGGNDDMPGSIALTANAAIKTGAGIVRLITTKQHPSVLPEIIVSEVKKTEEGTIAYENFDFICSLAEKSNVIAIGPGSGINSETIELYNSLIEKYKDTKKIIIDADGLRAINSSSILSKNVVLTPHLVEFSRTFSKSSLEIMENIEFSVRNQATINKCTILLKNVPTVISDGCLTYYNNGGNSGMATAGSGDVLTGIIASLAAQGLSTIDATAIGAFIHSMAGDLGSAEYSEYSLTASNMIDKIADVFIDLCL